MNAKTWTFSLLLKYNTEKRLRAERVACSLCLNLAAVILQLFVYSFNVQSIVGIWNTQALHH